MTGELAGRIIPVNYENWIQPSKVFSCFAGKYAQKVAEQTCVQAVMNAGCNMIRKALSLLK